MKTSFCSRHRNRLALTLIEILFVVCAVVLLFALILPMGSRPVKAKRVYARLQEADIAVAIQAYRNAYGRYPVPISVEKTALAANDDFTYGGPELNDILGHGSSTPANADVITILMDVTNSINHASSVNAGHNLNPQKIVFLNAKLVGNTTEPGVGTDMVYRDPWGHPYLITLDLNGDGRCRDAFYKNHLVSKKEGSTGFNALTNALDISGAKDSFEYQGGVMIWSLGPDEKADVRKPSIFSPNKDNLIGWH